MTKSEWLLNEKKNMSSWLKNNFYKNQRVSFESSFKISTELSWENRSNKSFRLEAKFKLTDKHKH